MTEPVAVLLAAGASRRFGRLKQLEPVGPDGEALLDYAVFDAMRSGFESIVVVARPAIVDAVRDHVTRRWPRTPVEFALQETPDNVEGSRRERPWGTGHAVLAAAAHITGPFAVANADDFYGASAWRSAASWLSQSTDEGQAAVIAYPIESTLSEHGGVSRAVIGATADGDVTAVTELLDVQRGSDGLTGRDERGSPIIIALDALVSMNLWAFHAPVLPLLARRFERFVESAPAQDEEFRLSTEIDALREDGSVRVRAVPTTADWFGVTHAEDALRVRSRIASLVAEGVYPARLGGSHLETGG